MNQSKESKDQRNCTFKLVNLIKTEGCDKDRSQTQVNYIIKLLKGNNVVKAIQTSHIFKYVPENNKKLKPKPNQPYSITVVNDEGETLLVMENGFFEAVDGCDSEVKSYPMTTLKENGQIDKVTKKARFYTFHVDRAHVVFSAFDTNELKSSYWPENEYNFDEFDNQKQPASKTSEKTEKKRRSLCNCF